MKTLLNQAQLNSLYLNILDNYESYGPVLRDRHIFYERIKNPSQVHYPATKPTMSFKKIIFPQNQAIPTNDVKKIALLGLANCDAWALDRFYKQFSETNLLPPRQDLFVIISECLPDESCFCSEVGIDSLAPGDMFVREKGTGYEVFAFSKIAKKILKQIGAKTDDIALTFETKKDSKDPIDLQKLRSVIEDKKTNANYWKDLSKVCYGCGACSTVCPLCFCFRQEENNDISGNSTICLKWDSCFAKEFSEIQFHRDMRPENSDRLYNWYHHKFVRAPFASGEVLCTGCGRCIDACPANLNTKTIASSLAAKYEDQKDDQKD